MKSYNQFKQGAVAAVVLAIAGGVCPHQLKAELEALLARKVRQQNTRRRPRPKPGAKRVWELDTVGYVMSNRNGLRCRLWKAPPQVPGERKAVPPRGCGRIHRLVGPQGRLP